MDGQGTKWRRKIVKNFSRLSKVHERYRQTDRQTTDRRRDGRQHIATRGGWGEGERARGGEGRT